jgi:hypothetical protein
MPLLVWCEIMRWMDVEDWTSVKNTAKLLNRAVRYVFETLDNDDATYAMLTKKRDLENVWWFMKTNTESGCVRVRDMEKYAVKNWICSLRRGNELDPHVFADGFLHKLFEESCHEKAIRTARFLFDTMVSTTPTHMINVFAGDDNDTNNDNDVGSMAHSREYSLWMVSICCGSRRLAEDVDAWTGTTRKIRERGQTTVDWLRFKAMEAVHSSLSPEMFIYVCVTLAIDVNTEVLLCNFPWDNLLSAPLYEAVDENQQVTTKETTIFLDTLRERTRRYTRYLVKNFKFHLTTTKPPSSATIDENDGSLLWYIGKPLYVEHMMEHAARTDDIATFEYLLALPPLSMSTVDWNRADMEARIFLMTCSYGDLALLRRVVPLVFGGCHQTVKIDQQTLRAICRNRRDGLAIIQWVHAEFIANDRSSAVHQLLPWFDMTDLAHDNGLNFAVIRFLCDDDVSLISTTTLIDNAYREDFADALQRVCQFSLDMVKLLVRRHRFTIVDHRLISVKTLIHACRNALSGADTIRYLVDEFPTECRAFIQRHCPDHEILRAALAHRNVCAAQYLLDTFYRDDTIKTSMFLCGWAQLHSNEHFANDMLRLILDHTNATHLPVILTHCVTHGSYDLMRAIVDADAERILLINVVDVCLYFSTTNARMAQVCYDTFKYIESRMLAIDFCRIASCVLRRSGVGRAPVRSMLRRWIDRRGISM